VNRASLPPAVILAAGESSRFWPLSTHGHKSLHRLAGVAIIERTVRSLAEAGVIDITVVQSPIARAAHFPHRTIEDQLGDGRRYGVTLRYLNQAEAAGPGPALRLAIDHRSGNFFALYPECLNAGPIVTELWQHRRGAAAVVAAREQAETWLFGTFALKGDDQLVSIVEKPPAGEEPSKLCNVGVYLLGDDYATELRAQPAHELSNLRALEALAQRRLVRVVKTAQPFFPLKYPWHLFAMADFVREQGDSPRGDRASVADSATVDAASIIESDCRIGAGVSITRCLIGAGSRIESSLADTIVGADVQVAPGVVIQNTPIQAGHVAVDVKGHVINTGLTELGTVIGQGSRVARGAALAAGVLVGAEARVGAGARVVGNVPDRLVV
jgi:NDP-sugar pyrophosphorylase family protein